MRTCPFFVRALAFVEKLHREFSDLSEKRTLNLSFFFCQKGLPLLKAFPYIMRFFFGKERGHP